MYRLLYIVFLFAALGASAQDMPERSEVRRGNRQYNKGNYEKSIERYERALEAAPESFEARYNLGNALYKAERFDKAEQTMRRPIRCARTTSAPKPSTTSETRSSSSRNTRKRSKATSSRCG